MSDQLKQNKKNAMSFYDLMFNQGKPAEAIEKFVGEVYIQHNPLVGDEKEAFIEFFEKSAKDYSGKRVYFKRAEAEGDYVVLHCYQEWPGDNDYASVDIFRRALFACLGSKIMFVLFLNTRTLPRSVELMDRPINGQWMSSSLSASRMMSSRLWGSSSFSRQRFSRFLHFGRAIAKID